MHKSLIWILFLIMALAACSEDSSLAGAIAKEMSESGRADYQIVHTEETAHDAVVLYLSGGDAAAVYFQLQDGRWKPRTGTACGDRGVTVVGLMGNGYLYCSTLREDMTFEAVRVGDADATLLQTIDGRRVWIGRGDDMEQAVTGVSSDGSEVKLN